MAETISNDYLSMINKKGSGYNIPVIVEAIVNAEIVPLRTSTTSKKEKVDAQMSGLASLKSSASLSKTAIDAISGSSNYDLLSTHPTTVSVKVNNANELGSFSKKITQVILAKSMMLTIPNYNPAAAFGAQDIVIRNAAGVAFPTVSVAAAETVASVVGKINSIPGIKAELVSTGQGLATSNSLLISGELGAANNFTIVSTANGNKINAALNDPRRQAAVDASITMDGLTVVRTSNTVTDLIEGVTLTLLADDVGTPPAVKTISSTLSAANVQATVKEFMDELNLYLADLDALGFVDKVGNEHGSLSTSAFLRNSRQQFIDLMQAPLKGYPQGGLENQPIHYIEFGIKTAKDGTYVFDQAIFDNTYAKAPEKFDALTVDRAYSSDPNVIVSALPNSKIPTGAHVFTNHVRYGQQPGSVSVGGFRGSSDIVHQQTINWQIEGHGSGSYVMGGPMTLTALAAALNGATNNAPNGLISIGANISVETHDHPTPSTRRLNITWAMPNRPNTAGVDEGDALTLTGTAALNNQISQVIGIPEIHQYNGFSSRNGGIPGQTINITVAGNTTTIIQPAGVPIVRQYNGFASSNGNIPGDTYTIVVDGVSHSVTQPTNESVTQLAARFNAINGLSAHVVNDGSGGFGLQMTGPSNGADISTPPIRNNSGPGTGITIQNRVAEQSVTQLAARFNAITGLSASVVNIGGLGGFGLKLTGPSNGADIITNAIHNGHTLSNGTAIQTRRDAVAFVANSAGAINTTAPTDEFYRDEVSGNAEFTVVEAVPAGSGVYKSPKYPGFTFHTTMQQPDMTIYVARSARTALSNFFTAQTESSGTHDKVALLYKNQSYTLANRLDKIDQKEALLTTRYTKQFASMETVVTNGSSSSEFITNMVAAWNKD